MNKERKQNNGPYEKFVQYGAESLTDAQLLAILLQSGPTLRDTDKGGEPGGGNSAVQMAEEVLSMAEKRSSDNRILGLSQMSLSELCRIRGIGKVKAMRLKCLGELSRRIDICPRKPLQVFKNPEEIAASYGPLILGDKEKVMLLLLNTKGALLHEEIISTGTVNCSLISPREIFLCALEYRAVFMVLLHNHPSGDAWPSNEDKRITEQLLTLGNMMHIKLKDHIIIGDGKYFSFLEAGLI